MIKAYTNTAGRRPRRGTALIEMILAIPLLATVIFLTYFFGWAMVNKQNVHVASRYTAWLRARTASDVSADDLNKTFFAYRAENVEVDRSTGTVETRQTLSDLVDAQADPEAAKLANAVIFSPSPSGRWAGVRAEFPSSVGLWQQFTGQIRGDYVRDGRQWRRIDPVSSHEEIADVFLTSLDVRLVQAESSGAGLAEMMRKLYLYHWQAWRDE